MNMIYMNIFIWVVLLVLFVIAEGLSAALTTIWFAIGSVAAGIATYMGAGFGLQLLIFLVVSVVTLLITRPIAMKYMGNKIEKTNVDALIGTRVVVTEDIDNLHETGKIRINDVEWTARSLSDEIITKDSVVEIMEIKGVKAIVNKI